MSVPPQAFVNKNKKHFLGIPAPLGYVAGVGRGYVFRGFDVNKNKEDKLFCNVCLMIIFDFQCYWFHYPI